MPISIETERLLLRPFREDDLDALYSRILDDQEVARHLESGGPLPLQRTQRLLERFIMHWDDHEYGVWAVTDKGSGGLIGYCGLRDEVEPGGVGMTFALAKSYWGRGLGTESAAAALRYGITRLNIPRVIALTRPENNVARRLLSRIGMRYKQDVKHFEMKMALYIARRDRFTANSESVFLVHRT
jgi:ribosomal-protein-alanine N-acetyltransferase